MSLILEATPEELRKQFSSLTTRKDIAQLLDIDFAQFIYYVYGIPEDHHYCVFTIPKNLGGFREISAPITPIKIIQRKLNQVLQAVYKPKIVVHSYIKGSKRSILTNAISHTKANSILNIDLKDFFPSINFGRVQGLFLKSPYDFNKLVASTLAKICCFNRALPQGAPTSPVISNMICARMDRQLSKLARDNDCTYTRYADDITFSCLDDVFPKPIVKSSTGRLELGSELISIISNNGFDINPDKVKLRTKFERQVVTGVVTNVFPNVRREYIRRVRAMLHAWSKYGLPAAEAEFRTKYDRKHRFEIKEAPSFKYVVKGKIDYIGMIKGKDVA
jgi:RNA-directed DNA polymerase